MRRVLAIFPGLVGFVILTGWYLDIESVERLGLASVSMNPTTAACFVLLSVAMFVEHNASRDVFRSRLAIVLYAVVAGVAALKMLDLLAGLKLGVDTTLFASKLDASRWHPNRMAPNTTLCFLLIGSAGLLVSRKPLLAVISGQLLAILTGAVALFALVGYAYGVTAFYEVPAFIPMAVHTGVCFLFVAGGVLATAPDRGVMAPIGDTGVAGRSARVLLPAAMLVPLVLGWLRLGGERAGLYPSEVGIALMITATVLLLAGLIWLNAQSLLAVDRKRAAAEAALRTLNDDLERRVRQRTAEIAQKERFLAAVLGNMQDALIVNKGGRIVFANDACVRLLRARDANDVLGRSIMEFVHPDYHAVSAERAKNLRAQASQAPVIEERIVRLDGTIVETEVTSASFFDESELVIIAMLRDLTARKLIEKQLQRSQRLDAIGQLTGGIAHDFNNLLVVITGNLDMLESDLADRPRSLGLAQMAAKAAWRGAELTRQLLAFSRRQSLEPKVIDLNSLVTETGELLQRTLGDGVELCVSLADDLWPAFVDPAQFESALTNLAINARDAMPNGGRLTFETANKHLDESYAAENEDIAPGDYVMLAVSDTGTGIPPEILAKVFEPFFTTKAEGKGSGLGLAMIYGFVKQSRGHVKIYSEVGHGTTVRVYLPKGAGAPSTVRDAATDLSAPRNATVLVVEDNPDVRKVAAGQLAQFGYTVIEAENGPAALKVLQSQAVDLLFTDAVMPGGMTGMDLAAEAPKLRPGLKILLTSGFAETPLNNSAQTVPLISKPYRKQDLAKKVREVLQA